MKCDELKSYTIYEGDVGNYTEHVVYNKQDADEAIAELKQKLEDANATAYAESVDAGMRERKLKRALYKACANWAHHRVFVRYKTNEKAWENVERKCRAMEEKYK